MLSACLIIFTILKVYTYIHSRACALETMFSCLWLRRLMRPNYQIIEMSAYEIEEEANTKREMLHIIKVANLRRKEIEAQIKRGIAEKRELYAEQSEHMLKTGQADECIKSKLTSRMNQNRNLQDSLKLQLIEIEKAESAYNTALDSIVSDRLRRHTLSFTRKLRLPEVDQVRKDTENISKVGDDIQQTQALSANSSGIGGSGSVSDPSGTRDLQIANEYERELKEAIDAMQLKQMPVAPRRALLLPPHSYPLSIADDDNPSSGSQPVKSRSAILVNNN